MQSSRAASYLRGHLRPSQGVDTTLCRFEINTLTSCRPLLRSNDKRAVVLCRVVRYTLHTSDTQTVLIPFDRCPINPFALRWIVLSYGSTVYYRHIA
jgi:hypothetical protein